MTLAIARSSSSSLSRSVRDNLHQLGLGHRRLISLLNPLQMAKLGAVLGVSLGFSAFPTLYVNRTLPPPGPRPN
jgi:hypothetical protein